MSIVLTDFQRGVDVGRIYAKGHLAARAPAGQRVRILTWNIARGADPAAIADRIAALQPDIACLQEVDWGNRRTGGADVLDILAQRTGMLGLFGTEFLELDRPGRPERFAGGGVTGNALLTRIDPVESFRIELPIALEWSKGDDPALPGQLRAKLRQEPRIGARFGIGAAFAVGDTRLLVSSVHFEDKAGGTRGRWAQFSAAAEAMRARAPGVSVIAGDFNTFDSVFSRIATDDNDETALGRPWHAIEAGWWKKRLLPTLGYHDPFPTRTWTFRIFPFFRAKLDWIASSGGRVLDSGVGDAGPSDHRLLWVDLVLRP